MGFEWPSSTRDQRSDGTGGAPGVSRPTTTVKGRVCTRSPPGPSPSLSLPPPLTEESLVRGRGGTGTGWGSRTGVRSVMRFNGSDQDRGYSVPSLWPETSSLVVPRTSRSPPPSPGHVPPSPDPSTTTRTSVTLRSDRTPGHVSTTGSSVPSTPVHWRYIGTGPGPS